MLSVRPSFMKAVKNIKPGQFERDSDSEDYRSRLIYTKQLRLFVYNPMIMNEILSDEEFKTLFFRTFGYEGNLQFTMYPNAWLRDLPLLNIGSDVYFGDGILLGTNQVSPDQRVIRVGTINIGSRSVFDQQCKIGYNTIIGNDCLFGIQCAVGIKSKIGTNVHLGGMTNVDHGTTIGDNVRIGSQSQIGSFCVIDEGVELPEFTRVPSFTHVTQIGMVNRRALKVRA